MVIAYNTSDIQWSNVLSVTTENNPKRFAFEIISNFEVVVTWGWKCVELLDRVNFSPNFAAEGKLNPPTRVLLLFSYTVEKKQWIIRKHTVEKSKKSYENTQTQTSTNTCTRISWTQTQCSQTYLNIVPKHPMRKMFLTFHISIFCISMFWLLKCSQGVRLDPDGTFPATFIEIPIPVFHQNSLYLRNFGKTFSYGIASPCTYPYQWVSHW